VGGFATPNLRLLNKKVFLDFEKPFDLIPKYKRSYKKRSRAEARLSEPLFFARKSPSFVWSQLLNAARTYFEKSTIEI